MIVKEFNQFKASGTIGKYEFFKYSSISGKTLTVEEGDARSDYAIGVALEEVGDGEILSDFYMIGDGKIRPVKFGETIAVGEFVCVGTAGTALDYDTSGDINHGRCVVAKDDNDIGYFHNNFPGTVHAG